MENVDPRIDAYIAKAGAFAKPVLSHLRQLVHAACPEIVETMKWSMPFFDYKGTVCQMSAFKQHCGFGFWKASLLRDEQRILHHGEESAAGSIGRITSLDDLPADEILIAYIKEAVALNDAGVKTTQRVKPKPRVDTGTLTVPDEFLTMLEENKIAQQHFDKFSPSKQKEYIEWFAEAKTEATKLKRIQQALEWISEGKSRHWRYQTHSSSPQTP